MSEDLPPGHHLKHGASHPIGNATAEISGIVSLTLPAIVLASPVRIALDQIIGHEQPCGPHPSVTKARQIAATSPAMLGNDLQNFQTDSMCPRRFDESDQIIW